MMNFSQVLPLIERRLKDMQPKEAVEFKTYKKDRSLLLYLGDNEQFQLIERGFENEDYSGDARNIMKQVIKSLRIEFPRSNKAWVYYYRDLDSPLELKTKNRYKMPLL